MKLKLIFLATASFFLMHCSEKEDAEPSTQNNAPDTTQQPAVPGHVIFYLKMYPFSNYGSGVDVWLNWVSTQNPGTHLGKITNVPQNVPSCGSWWGLNFSDTLSAFTYHAKVDGANNKVWDGSFNLSSGTCIQVELDNE